MDEKGRDMERGDEIERGKRLALME